MDISQDLVNVLLGLGFSIGGWFARVLWTSLDSYWGTSATR